MSMARHLAAGLRGLRALSQAQHATPALAASSGRWAVGHAAAAPGSSVQGKSQQQQHGHMGAATAARMPLMQRLGLPSITCSPFPLPAASMALNCAGLSTSTAAAAPAAGGGPLSPTSGDESGDDESTPHLRGRAEGSDANPRRQAHMAMVDPMSRLMASRGMPLGISLDNAEAPGTPSERAAANQAPYPMEALGDIFQTTKQGAGGDEAPVPAVDSWGTTKEGPAEIARRLAESNRELDAMELPEEKVEEEVDEEFKLAPGEAKYRTLEQMSKDIKGLDEVFDVLASVPWLDETNVQQKELKGVAMIGLLGTLEEVGFNIRAQVQRIWAGERDHSIITECSEAKDQAALISILFHTKRLEEEYGPPSKPVTV